MVRNHRENQKWVPGCVTTRASELPGSRVRYCNVEHPLRTKIVDSDSNGKIELMKRCQWNSHSNEPEVVTDQLCTMPNLPELRQSSCNQRQTRD